MNGQIGSSHSPSSSSARLHELLGYSAQIKLSTQSFYLIIGMNEFLSFDHCAEFRSKSVRIRELNLNRKILAMIQFDLGDRR
ncbi:hypothetical protein U1Q18_018309 [Sarracenia purpurea var. burkii]